MNATCRKSELQSIVVLTLCVILLRKLVITRVLRRASSATLGCNGGRAEIRTKGRSAHPSVRNFRSRTGSRHAGLRDLFDLSKKIRRPFYNTIRTSVSAFLLCTASIVPKSRRGRTKVCPVVTNAFLLTEER